MFAVCYINFLYRVTHVTVDTNLQFDIGIPSLKGIQPGIFHAYTESNKVYVIFSSIKTQSFSNNIFLSNQSMPSVTLCKCKPLSYKNPKSIKVIIHSTN